MKNSVSVNVGRCIKAGKVLKGLKIRKAFTERDFLTLKADRETKLRLYLFSAAVCHQTYSLVDSKRNLYGWDFMEYAFLKMVENKVFLFGELNKRNCTAKKIKETLTLFFSSTGHPSSCTLDRLDERARMIEELCLYAIEKHNGSISEMLDGSNGLLINKGKGLYETLGRFESFNDPLKKKITFFLKLATGAGVIHIADPENIIPIMDYHMQRVLMRMGCVEINDRELYKMLVERKPADTDTEVRQACVEAIRIIADSSGHGIMKMNDFFWPLGRSCCNENPLCVSNSCEKEPCTFYTVVELETHTTCIFENVCKGKNDEHYRNLWQPVVNTNYY